MQYALYKLGEQIIRAVGNDKKTLLSYLVDKAAYEREKGKEKDVPRIFALHFKTKEDCVELEDLGEVGPKEAVEYLWIGNASRNSPQNRLTTDNLQYLLSQTIPNLLKGLPRDRELSSRLSSVKEQFFIKAKELGVQGKGEGDLIMNIGKFRFFSGHFQKPSNTNCKEFLTEISKLLIEDLMEKYGLRKIPKDSLFTVFVDGEALVNHNDYSQYIYFFFLEEPFKNKQTGRCHICGKEAQITQEYTATRFRFSYYITDKVGFASGINKERFYKNFALCRDCYSPILLAEEFVWQNLRSSLGGQKFCLIPSFYYELPLTLKQLEKLSAYLKDSFQAVDTLKGYNKFRAELEEYVEEKEHSKSYTLHLIFYNYTGKEFKVLKLIEDIPPSRLEVLNQITNETKDKADGIFGEDESWYIGISCISGLLYPQRARGKVGHYKYLLDFYESLLAGKPVEYQPLIARFVDLAKVKFYEPKNTGKDFVYSLIQTNLLIEILRQLNILKGGDFKGMNLDELRLPENIKSYMEEIGTDEPRGALFLLGYLIGEIGYEQSRGDADKKTPKKPILNKITYQGMNLNKLIRLSNDVFDKLRQYGLLDYKRELIHGAMKRLMDRNSSSWKISDQENVYWVLSGYAFSTLEKMKKKEKPIEETLEKED